MLPFLCKHLLFFFLCPSTEDTVSSKDEGRTFKDQPQENEEKRPDVSVSSTTVHKSIFGGHRKIG